MRREGQSSARCEWWQQSEREVEDASFMLPREIPDARCSVACVVSPAARERVRLHRLGRRLTEWPLPRLQSHVLAKKILFSKDE